MLTRRARPANGTAGRVRWSTNRTPAPTGPPRSPPAGTEVTAPEDVHLPDSERRRPDQPACRRPPAERQTPEFPELLLA